MMGYKNGEKSAAYEFLRLARLLHFILRHGKRGPLRQIPLILKEAGMIKERLVALIILLVFLAASAAYGQSGRRIPPSGTPTEKTSVIDGELKVAPSEKDTSSVTGYIEDILAFSILLNGKYYDIGGVKIKDLEGNEVDRELLEIGAKVEIKLKKSGNRIKEIIFIQTSKAEGRRQ
jgi:hypothetical protein